MNKTGNRLRLGLAGCAIVFATVISAAPAQAMSVEPVQTNLTAPAKEGWSDLFGGVKGKHCQLRNAVQAFAYRLGLTTSATVCT